MNLRPHQEEDPPWPVDGDQSSMQEAGSSRTNRNRHNISTVHEGYHETFQCVMAKNAVLEQQSRKLTWSIHLCTEFFALLTIQSPRTCKKGERTTQGQLQWWPTVINDS